MFLRLRSVLQTIRRFSSRLHHRSGARTQIHSTRLGDVRSHRSNSKYLLRTEFGESTFGWRVSIGRRSSAFQLHDVDVGAIINRELKNRIRTINGIGQHKTIVRNDLRLITKIIKQLDERWNIWNSSESENSEKKPTTTTTTTATSSDDSEISSSTAAPVTSPTKNKKPIGFVSQNPLLKNITDHLVEEADAEEEELLGDSANPNGQNTFEMDKELNKVNRSIVQRLRLTVRFRLGFGSSDSLPSRRLFDRLLQRQ